MDSIRNLPEEQPVLRNYSEELAKIIRSGISPRALKDRLSDYHQRDIAEVLEELTPRSFTAYWTATSSPACLNSSIIPMFT